MLKVKWKKVFYTNEFLYPVIRYINLGNGTMFRIISFLNVPKFVFNDAGSRLFVGIQSKGCFLFTLNNEIRFDYVMEKLNLCKPDAEIISDWINTQLDFNENQQGIYYERYILDTEEYGLIWEKKSFTLTPEIINE